MSELPDRSTQALIAALHNQALLLVLLENQAVIFDRLGLEAPPETTLRDDFEARRWAHVETMAASLFGDDTAMRLMLRRMGIEPGAPDTDG